MAVNPKHTAYALVAYDRALLDCVLARYPSLAPTERVSVLHDLIRLTFPGTFRTTTFGDVLAILGTLSTERDYGVWSMAATVIGRVLSLLDRAEPQRPLATAFRQFVANITRPAVQALGFDSRVGTFVDRKLRPVILSLAAGAKDTAVVSQATALFARFRAGNATAVPGDIARVMLRTAVAAEAGKPEATLAATFDFLEQQYKTTTSSNQRLNLLYAMGSTPSAALQEKFLQYTLQGVIRSQDIAGAFVAIGSASPQGYSASLKFLCSKWKEVTKLSAARTLIPRVFPGASTE